MKRASFIVLAGLSACANAAGWGGLKNLSQSEFRDVAGDLGAAFSYKALSPGDPLGITGFDVGVEAGLSKVQAARAFDKATGWNASFLSVTRLHAHKGLPFDFDVGFSLARVPGLDASLTGAEVRWAPLDGSMLLPALSVRGTYSRLAGVNELDFRAYGLEAALSKGILIFKPYLGLGYVRSKSSPSVGGLDEVSLGQSKRFAGVNINLGLVNYAVELDRTGETMTYGLKAGLRF
jgi:hypothetical protein